MLFLLLPQGSWDIPAAKAETRRLGSPSPAHDFIQAFQKYNR
jgi:hypothetical protein